MLWTPPTVPTLFICESFERWSFKMLFPQLTTSCLLNSSNSAHFSFVEFKVCPAHTRSIISVIHRENMKCVNFCNLIRTMFLELFKELWDFFVDVNTLKANSCGNFGFFVNFTYGLKTHKKSLKTFYQVLRNRIKINKNLSWNNV